MSALRVAKGGYTGSSIRCIRPDLKRLEIGSVSRRKRSAIKRSAKALPWNCRLSGNSIRSSPRKRATRRRHCGMADASRSVFPKRAAAARIRTPLGRISPRYGSSCSRSSGSFSRPIRTDSATVFRISAVSGSSTDHPVALVLPAPLRVHAFETHAVVFVGRHAPSRVADAPTRDTPVLNRWRRSRAYANHDRIAVRGYSNGFDPCKRRWVDGSRVHRRLATAARRFRQNQKRFRKSACRADQSPCRPPEAARRSTRPRVAITR